VAGLELVGFRPFLDRHDIAAAEDWEARLGALILGRRYGCLYSLTRRGQVRALCMGSRARRRIGQTADPGPGDPGAGGSGAGAAAVPQLHLLSRRSVFRAAARRIGGGAAAGCRMDSRTYTPERGRRAVAGQRPRYRGRQRSAAARRRPGRRPGMDRAAQSERPGNYRAAHVISGEFSGAGSRSWRHRPSWLCSGQRRGCGPSSPAGGT